MRERIESAIRFLENELLVHQANQGVVDSIRNRIGPLRGYLRLLAEYDVPPSDLVERITEWIEYERVEGYLVGFEDEKR